jgi:hypothetical protein
LSGINDYCYGTTNLTDYMGINESDAGTGNPEAWKHYPLFRSCSILDFYVKDNGNDVLDCNSIIYACKNLIGTNYVGQLLN